ncbi:DUF3943 domain-containing protein [Psychromonas sp.]|uniref:DUF3943 domain-containing protein n=1 Tax=Psychromonas sp. TaxID=1884585 RepID=UPI00356B0755
MLKLKKLCCPAIYLVMLTLPTPLLAEPDATETISYYTPASNSVWETKNIEPGFYDSPYTISLFNAQHGEDSERLLDQTYTVLGSGFGVLGVFALMPTSVTNWQEQDESLANKWLDHVKQSPVWDRDDLYLNVLGHGYFGGVYYQSARKSGYRQWDSFIYSFMMSTFYWEYGMEAFAETPSIQDLILTPILGWAYGEWAFKTEQDIYRSDGKLFGSTLLGDSALFLLDPVDTIGRNVNYLLGRDILKAGTGYFTYQQGKAGYGEQVENQVGLQIHYSYGIDDSHASAGISNKRNKHSTFTTRTVDPVTTGIIGFSAGAIYVNPNRKWGLRSGYGQQWSLGLYFTNNISTRLNYSTAQLKDKVSNESVKYENYGLDTQYYFNHNQGLRPFITSGFGETMYQESVDSKTFQINAGLGLHYKLNNKWSVQSDWRFVYTPELNTDENQFSTSLLYRFSEGEVSR